MAARTRPLTDTQIRQARPREKEYNLADGDGLFLRVKPSGTKTWLLNYFKPYTRSRSNIALGRYPTVTLAAARQTRTEYLTLLSQNIDPKTHREEEERKEREAYNSTLARILEKWIAVKRTKVTKAHAEDIERSLNNHLMPKLGGMPIHLVRARDVIAVLEPIAHQGKLETVKRLTQRLNDLMIYAVNTGMIEHNPLAGIGKAFAAPTKTHMPTLQPDQLPDFMRSIANASIKITTRCLIEWELHTMVRPSEAAGARWEEIDNDKLLWVIPAERMKKKRQHSVPLTPQMLALLDTMKPISGHLQHIFPADRDQTRHTNEQTANMAIKRMGYEGKLVAHGLRSLASTTLNEQGFDPDLIEAALAHTDKNDVRSAYNRAEYIERRRTMMAWWSDHIETASQGTLSISGYKHLRAVAG